MNSNDGASLAKTYLDIYLAGADTKNSTSMIPGLAEVIYYSYNNNKMFQICLNDLPNIYGRSI